LFYARLLDQASEQTGFFEAMNTKYIADHYVVMERHV